MWFLNGKPEEILIKFGVKSLDKGYQQNTVQFKVTGNEKMRVGLVYPMAPNKKLGGVEINNVNVLKENGVTPECKQVTEYSIYTKLRDLKKELGIQLVHVQELLQWYIDDYGIITFYIEPNVMYEINYKHKINSESCLFIPTRLPTLITHYKPKIVYELYNVNGKMYDLPKFLVKDSGMYKFVDKFGYDCDVSIHTDNWESSDDLSKSE